MPFSIYLAVATLRYSYLSITDRGNSFNFLFSLDSDRDKSSVATMPRCVLNENCAFPNLELRAGHQCPRCLGSVHVLCGVEDPNCTDLHLNVTCNACAGLLPATVQPETTTPATTETTMKAPKEKTNDKKKKEAVKEKTKSTKKKAAPKKAAPKKKSTTAKKSEHAARLVPPKHKKSDAA